MKKVSKILMSIAAIAVIAFMACNKESTTETASVVSNPNASDETAGVANNATAVQGLVEQSTASVHYFYNGVAVEAGTFDPGLEESNTLVLSSLSDGGKQNINIHGFSSEENFCAYGDANNIPLRKRRAVENHLEQYAISSGAVAEYERTGIEPQWYNDYVMNYLNSQSTSSAVQSRTSLTAVHDACNGGLPSVIVANYMATMYAGTWNNRVSSFFPLGIYGFNTFYDRTFFRTRLATFWLTGFDFYSFCTPELNFMNDKTSSMFSGL